MDRKSEVNEGTLLSAILSSCIQKSSSSVSNALISFVKKGAVFGNAFACLCCNSLRDFVIASALNLEVRYRERQAEMKSQA